MKLPAAVGSVGELKLRIMAPVIWAAVLPDGVKRTPENTQKNAKRLADFWAVPLNLRSAVDFP